MKVLTDGFGHSLSVRDEDAARALQMLKDSGKDYRLEGAHGSDSEAGADAGDKADQRKKKGKG